MSVATGAAHYASDEPRPDGRVFNRDSGSLRPARLQVDGDRGAWTWRASVHQASGALDYAGQTQLGIPLTTRTDLSRRGAGLNLGHALTLGEGMPVLVVNGGAEWVRTVRDIQGTPISSRLTETLRTRQWTLGAEAVADRVWQAHPIRGAAAVQLNRPWSHTLAVDAHGVIDPIALHPGARWGHRIDLSLAWSATADADVSLAASWETYRPGASETRTAFRNGVPTGAASYPGSVQRIRQIVMSLTWRL